MTSSRSLTFARQSILPPCPDMVAEPYSRAESIPHILLCIEKFCSLHCGADCFGCFRWKSENTFRDDYVAAFMDLHAAFEYLPEHDSSHLSWHVSVCPACSIVKAMQMFRVIARYSTIEPVSGEFYKGGGWMVSQPCFPISQDESCTDFEALKQLNPDSLPPLPPPELRKAKSAISNAQYVLKYLSTAVNHPDDVSVGIIDPSNLESWGVIIENKPMNNSNAQSTAKSDAIANGTGIGEGGDGGDGGDATAISAPENNSNQVFDVKEGALQNNNTVNIAGQGDVVRETRETVFQTLEWVKENPGAVLGITSGAPGKPSGSSGRKSDSEVQGKADADLWNEWETAKAAKVLKADFAADKGMPENELQNALDRHRKRLGR